MIIPVRCFTCNECIGHLWEEYQAAIAGGASRDETLTNLGFPPDKYCCRRMFLGHVDVIDDLLMYSVVPGKKSVSKSAFYTKQLAKEPEPDIDPSGLDADMEPDIDLEADIDEEAEYGFRITKDLDSDAESQQPEPVGDDDIVPEGDPDADEDLEDGDDDDLDDEDEPEDDLVDATFDDDE